MKSKIISLWWGKVPTKIRKAFFALPIFIQWLPAKYIENDKEVKEVSYIASSYFVAYLLLLIFCYVIYHSIDLVYVSSQHYLYYFIYIFYTIVSVCYIIFSLVLVYECITDNKLFLRKLRINFFKKFLSSIENLF